MITRSDVKNSRSLKATLGHAVSVKVDRTYQKSFFRKKHYINCGTVVSPDDFQNKTVYVLGYHDAVTEAQCEIIGIIKSRNKEDEFVAAPAGLRFYEPYIAYMLSNFVDKTARYICYYEKSCGAVLFTYKEGIRYYILIKNMSGHVGFPKGHVEFGEDEFQAALREIYEETGVHTELIDGYRRSYNYIINGCVKKEAVYFTAPFEEKDVKMRIKEISEYKLVTYDEGMQLLNYAFDKEILTSADEFITSKGL